MSIGKPELLTPASDARADGVVIEARADAKMLLTAGLPQKEPIVRHGLFVTNTRQKIFRAVNDFRQTRLGEVAG
jgi:quercetin 2,3-dioxygenase